MDPIASYVAHPRGVLGWIAGQIMAFGLRLRPGVAAVR